MKKLFIILFSLLSINLAFSQKKAIKITNLITKKEKVIKENKRIKIKTIDNKKISGRFKIENDNIMIKEKYISLDDIKQIKRNPMLFSIFTSGFLIYGGAIVTGFGAIIGLLVQPSGYLLAIPGAAMIYAGIKSPSMSKNYKNDKWKYEIITISD